MMTPQEQYRLCQLILKSLEETISQEELDLLDRCLCENPDALEYYGNCIELFVQMKKPGQFPARLPTGLHCDTVLDTAVWDQLSEYEKVAPIVEIPQSQEIMLPIQKVQVEKTHRQINKFSLYTALLSMAALLLLLAWISMFPRYVPKEVATLTDEIGAVWKEDGTENKKGSRLYSRRESSYLIKGCAKIDFDEGASVVLEGPAEFEINSSSQMQLKFGRLYAQVPHEAIGFTVITNNSKIIDLGTEFGIQYDFQGNTSLHVLRGDTQLLTLNAKKKNTAVNVTAGQAKSVDSLSGEVKSISLSETLFVRKIDSDINFVWRGEQEKVLDLADMVGGGDGLGTGKTGAVCDYKTGRLIPYVDNYDYAPSMGKFVRTVFSPFVDGIFVPQEGPLQVSSRGDVYASCPFTEGLQWEYPANGPWTTPGLNGDIAMETWMLGGVEYGTREKPAIYLHSNNGITFDLNAIRKAFPSRRNLRFTALCGIAENVKKALEFDNPLPKASVHVLIDGIKRFEKIDLEVTDGVIPISMEIADSDRFLTLMTTNGSDGSREWDWVLFAEPCIHIDYTNTGQKQPKTY